MRNMFITLCAVGMLAGCGGPYALTDAEKTTAELGARDYADRDRARFVSCSGQDSDRDGYITCTIAHAGAAAADAGRNEDVLCSYKNGARGCKRKK